MVKAPSGRGWLRIIGGVWRGRKIPVLATEAMRPTNERAREAIFNRLMHAEETLGVRLRSARVADIFAGTGALGLEALSRGAGSAVFVERDRATCKALEQTLSTLGADDRADVLNADATSLPSSTAPCDIVLLDPPYAANLVEPTLASLSTRGWLKPGAVLVLETDADTPLALPAGFTLIDQRHYGRAHIAFLKHSQP